MSVASRTTVGGYHNGVAASKGQFDVNDDRDVPSFCSALNAKGLQPVFKDWDVTYREVCAPVGGGLMSLSPYHHDWTACLRERLFHYLQEGLGGMA